MIKFEKTKVCGWEEAIRGMRNPMNSWAKSDSKFDFKEHCCDEFGEFEIRQACNIGENDYSLMKRLRDAGTDHRKFMRMIAVYVDITAPLYWWKEFDTYKVGTVANSCSTMHKIHSKEFTLEDFSCERLISTWLLETIVNELNIYRDIYNDYDNQSDDYKNEFSKKVIWQQMIQLLPSSYNQKRTVMLNYEVLANIYNSRRYHKLDEWREFCCWIEDLPYSELITGRYYEPEEVEIVCEPD